MKILSISQDLDILSHGTGARVRMRQYADALGELHMVVLAGPDGTAGSEPPLFIYPARSTSLLGRRFAAFKIVYKLCRENAFDVVTVQSPDELGLLAYFIARKFGIPLQVQIHADVLNPHYRRAGWKERIRYHLAKFLIPRADCIRVVSERIRRSILDSRFMIHDLRITVLPIFTDISGFTVARRDPRTDEQLRGYEFKMIAAGRFMDKEKNFSMLIEMMRDLVKIYPKALLVIVGDGPDKDRYKLQATSYNLLGKNIIIEPWRNDLSSFYRSFDLYLMSSNFEGWGRTVIEAMASGLPVVMTDVGVAGEIVKDGENGLVVGVGDKDAFLKACCGLYDNRGELRRLAAAAGQTAKIFGFPDRAGYIDEYKNSLMNCCG